MIMTLMLQNKYIFNFDCKSILQQNSFQVLYSKMKGQESKISRKNQNLVLTEGIIMITEKMNNSDKIDFLTAYFLGHSNIIPNSKNYQLLKQNLQEMNEVVGSQIISATNYIEILVQTSNMIRSMKSSMQNQKLMTKFNEQAMMLVGQVNSNRRYLKQKWMRESNPSIPKPGKQNPKVQEVDEQTMKLIKMLQQEDQKERNQRSLKQQQADKKFQQFMKEQEKRFIQKSKLKTQSENAKIMCEVCSEQINYSEIGTLTCGHMFHQKCLRGYIQALVSQKKIDIPCPSGCGSFLNLSDVEEFIDGDLKEKYDKFCFDLYVEKNLDKNTSWCPTAGCPAVFTHDGALDNYRCPTCSKHYCLNCRCIYHRGVTCAQYRISNTFSENDKKFQDFAIGAKFKQCPKCNFWVERTTGCNSMACRCGMTFCYECGGTGCGHGECRNSGKK